LPEHHAARLSALDAALAGAVYRAIIGLEGPPVRVRLALVAVLGMTAIPAAPAASADDFVVIVNPSVPGTNVKRSDLAKVFMKTATRWGSAGAAVPVDQSGTSPVRKAFSEAVLGQPVAQVVQYWQKQVSRASSLRPPPVKANDVEVLAFVANNQGAVGYVSAGIPLPPDVKALTLVD
jgi:ABC-type phosphate transport system substrate-binding protein